MTPIRRLTLLAVVLLAAAVVFAADAPPDWAYAKTPANFKLPGNGSAKQRVPGSTREYTFDQIRDTFLGVDWFPGDHPMMPAPVGEGRKPGVQACAACHLPTGLGMPQTAMLAGLPADYLTAQLNDFALGNRLPAVGSVNIDMGSIARAITPAETRAAVQYFSRLKARPWIKVVEAAMVPATQTVEGDLVVPAGSGDMEAIGTRIVEVPDAPERARLRDPRATFVAYVPPGSVARGRNLVRTGGAAVVRGQKIDGKTTECSKCHGVDLRGMPAKPDGTPLAPSLLGHSPSYTVRQLYDIQRGARKGSSISDMKNNVQQLTTTDMIDIAAYLGSRMP